MVKAHLNQRVGLVYYKLSTTKESNSQNSWYGWVIDFDKVLDMSKEAEVNTAKLKHFIKVLNKVIFLVR